ncbi:MAG: type IV pilus modification protein PilV [Halieaceae bacterium]
MSAKTVFNSQILPARQSGVALLEVAIAVLILSIGTLGLAGLQIASKRAGFEAVQRTTASALATDIIERMRGNPVSLASYDGVTIDNDTATDPPSYDCKTASCDEAAIAVRDLYEWEQAIVGANEVRTIGGTPASVGGLGGVVGCIDTTAGGVDGAVEVAIAWEGFLSLDQTLMTNTCGNGIADNRRQLLVVRTFISDE